MGSRKPGSMTDRDFGDARAWAFPGFLQKITTITSAQLLALNATAQTLVPAPGSGLTALLDEIKMVYSGGTAYAGIAAGEDMQARYTSAAGAVASEIQEVTGWLDQTTGSTKWIRRLGCVAGTLNVYSENALLCMHMLTGEITTGTGTIKCETRYRIEPTTIRD